MNASARKFNAQGRFSVKQFLSKMKHLMEHHPVASNSVLCLNLWVAGDVIAQYSEHKLLHQVEQEHRQQQQLSSSSADSTVSPPPSSEGSSASSSIDPIRVLTSAGYGAFIYGPLLAVWYPYLDRMCKAYKIAARFGAWGAPIAKVVADELIMSPPCLFLFFGYMNICEGGSLQTYKNKLHGEFFPSWLTSITFWPPISLATFRFLPVYAQAPVINAVCILWDAFLSHRNALANINERANNANNKAAGSAAVPAVTASTPLTSFHAVNNDYKTQTPPSIVGAEPAVVAISPVQDSK